MQVVCHTPPTQSPKVLPVRPLIRGSFVRTHRLHLTNVQHGKIRFTRVRTTKLVSRLGLQPEWNGLYRVCKTSKTHGGEASTQSSHDGRRYLLLRTRCSPDVGYEAAAQHADGRLGLVGPSVQHFGQIFGAQWKEQRPEVQVSGGHGGHYREPWLPRWIRQTASNGYR